jgi:hypothetical protein
MLMVAAVAVLCTGCVSAPQDVREQASSELACDASQVKVKQTVRHYLGAYALEAEGCGRKLTYECEQAYVLLIRVGTLSCHRK